MAAALPGTGSFRVFGYLPMSNTSELWVPRSAQATIKHRQTDRLQKAIRVLYGDAPPLMGPLDELIIEKAAENLEPALLEKSIGESGLRYPRRILAPLAASGYYRGVQDPVVAERMSQQALRQTSRFVLVRTIIENRVRLVQRYARSPRYRGDTGYRVALRDASARPSAIDRKWIERITAMLGQGGSMSVRASDGARGVFSADGYDEALPLMQAIGMIVRDLLTLDAAAVWLNQSTEPGIPWTFFKPIDAGLVRRAMPKLPPRTETVGSKDAYTPYETELRSSLPHVEYVQIAPDNSKIVQEFGRGDLIYIVRNPRSEWWAQGYGYSEVETLLEVVLGLKLALQYNVSQFTESHIPPMLVFGKGQFSVEWLEDAQRMFIENVGGPGKWFRTPFIFGEADADLKILPMRNNQHEDVAWRDLMSLLMNMACASFGVAAEEVGFQSFLTRGGLQTGTGGAERVATAQDTGLRSLLYATEGGLSRGLVEPFFPDPATGLGPFKLIFEGLDVEDDDRSLDRATRRMASGLTSVNEERAERDDAPVRDPQDPDLHEKCRRELLERCDELETDAEMLAELTAELYEKRGGKWLRWPEIPISPSTLQLRMQEQQELAQAEQAEQAEQPFDPNAPDVLHGAMEQLAGHEREEAAQGAREGPQGATGARGGPQAMPPAGGPPRGQEPPQRTAQGSLPPRSAQPSRMAKGMGHRQAVGGYEVTIRKVGPVERAARAVHGATRRVWDFVRSRR